MKAKQPNKGPAGRRPKLTPDAATLQRVLELGERAGSTAAAAAALRVPRESFERFLATHVKARSAWHRGQVRARAALRRRQFEEAKTSPAMAIWLGKQYLGQKDPNSKESKSKRREEYWRWFYGKIG